MIFEKPREIKISIISHFGYPLYNKNCKVGFGGGADLQLFFLSKEFCKNSNLKISIITGIYKNNKNEVEFAKNLTIFKVLPIKRKIFNYLKGLINLCITLIKIKPDVIIQRTASAITGICAFYCKIYKKVFIFSIANQTNVNGVSESGILGKIFKYGIDNANFIIAQSKQQILDLQLYKRRKFNNIKVIKSGYKVGETYEKNGNYILWVARAVDWKRPELFLKLAQEFPNEKFFMICNIYQDKAYWKKIYKKASEISNLSFLRYVPFNEIDKYFQDAKLFINTSIYEGFPNTFIQSFKNKTPVISLNINPDKVLNNYNIGYFCNNDFSIMVKYLKEILRNQEIYRIFSDNSFLYVKHNHDIKKITDEWIKLIKNLI